MKEYEISEQTRRALEQTSRKVKYRSITTILSNAWKSPCKCEGFLKLAIAWNSENKHGVAGESIELTLEIARLFERFNLLLRANIYVARKRERERILERSYKSNRFFVMSRERERTRRTTRRGNEVTKDVCVAILEFRQRSGGNCCTVTVLIKDRLGGNRR